MRILILGGFGFMGKNLNNEFEGSNHIIFNESRKTGCDLLNYVSLRATLHRIKPDLIINASAHVGSIKYVMTNAAIVMNDNTQMYVNLYKAIAEVNPKIKIINPISNCSYPGIIDIQNEKDWWNGEIHHSVMGYGNAKKAGYILSKCYESQYGIKTINLIMANSYGPNDYVDEERTHAMNGIIMRMINAQKNKDEKFIVWGTGSPIREWIYMPDMAKIIKNIIDNEKWNLPNPINVGIGMGVSIKETVMQVKEYLNFDCEIVFDINRPDGAPIKVLGVDKFKELFPDFKFTTYNEGIRNTINYYKGVL